MQTSSKNVKTAARARQAAKKAGVKITEQNETKNEQPHIEQEQPDIA